MNTLKRNLLLTLSGLAWASAASAATLPPEKLLPTDTLAVLTLPDYSQTSATWKRGAMSQFWADPAMKPFRDKFMTKFRDDFQAPLEREFGVKLSDYTNFAQGQMTLAITPNNWDGSKGTMPGFVFVLDAGSKADALKSHLSSVKKKWVDSGKQIRSEKIRDVEFTTLIFTDEDLNKALEKAFPPKGGAKSRGDGGAAKPKSDRKHEWHLGQSDSLLIVGSSAKDLEKVLIRQSGGSVAALGEQAAFSGNFNSMLRGSSIYGWANTKTVVDIVTKQLARSGAGGGGDDGGGMPKPDKLIASLGLNDMQSLAFSLKDTPEGAAVHTTLAVPEAARKGLFKILAWEAKDASPPPFIPADATKFTRSRVDLQKAFATLESTLVEISPQIGGVIKLVMESAGKDKDPNFDLRKNLIANLGDDIVQYHKAPREFTMAGMQNQPSIFLLSSAKADQLASAIQALGAVMPQTASKYKEREFLGRKVYALPLPPMQDPQGGKPVERTLHYAASGGYVALTTDVAMLEEYLRSSGNAPKALRETSGLSEAAQKVGGQATGIFGYENQLENTRATFEMLRKESGSLANLFGGGMVSERLGVRNNAARLKDWTDFSLLPPFEKIAKYFHYNVWSAQANGDGLHFKVFAPTPPQLKK